VGIEVYCTAYVCDECGGIARRKPGESWPWCAADHARASLVALTHGIEEELQAPQTFRDQAEERQHYSATVRAIRGLVDYWREVADKQGAQHDRSP